MAADPLLAAHGAEAGVEMARAAPPAKTRRPWRPHFRHAAEAVAVAGVVAAALAGVVAWRLSQGPLPLGPLTGLVERAVAAGGGAVRMEGARLVWDGRARLLSLVADTVRAQAGAAGAAAEAKDFALAVRPLDLLSGRIAPARLRAEGGTFTVLIRRDGEVALRLGAPPVVTPAPADAKRAARLVESVRRLIATQAGRPQLDQANLVGADVAVVDEATGLAWTARGLDAGFARDGGRIAARLTAQVQAGDDQGAIDLSLRGAERAGPAAVEVRVAGLNPSRLAARDLIGPAAAIDAPVSGQATITLRDGTLEGLNADLALAAGTLRLAARPTALTGGALRARFDQTDRRLVVEALRLDTAPGALALAGDVEEPQRLWGEGGAPFRVTQASGALAALGVAGLAADVRDVRASGVLDLAGRRLTLRQATARWGGASLQVAGAVAWPRQRDGTAGLALTLDGAVAGELGKADLLAVWPAALADGARDWVAQSILDGRILGGPIRVRVTPEDLRRRRLDREDVFVRVALRDGVIRYLPGLTPLSGAAGVAELTGDSLTVRDASGRIGAIEIRDGSVQIPRFHPKGAPATVTAQAAGSVRDMARLLDMGRLRLFSNAGVSPERLDGRAVVRLTIARPTLRQVPDDQIAWSVSGDIAEARFADAFLGEDLTRGALRLEADNRQIRVSGPADWGGARLDLLWREALQGRDANPTLVLASGVADAETLKLFGLRLDDLVSGAIGVDVRATGRGGRIAGAVVNADLARTAVRAPGLGWAKRAGAPAAASFRVFPTEEGGWRLADIRADGSGLSLAGEMRLSPEGRIRDARFPRVDIDGLAAFAATASAAGDVLRVEADGPFLNAQGLAAALVGDAPPGRGDGALALEGRFDRVRFAPDSELTQAVFEAVVARGMVESLTARGRSPAGATTLTITPRAGGVRRLELASADAGLAARALYPGAPVAGGSATISGDLPPAGAARPTQLQLRAENFTVTRPATRGQPAQTYSFARALAPVSIARGRVTLEEARASGPSLGLTAQGYVDLRAQTLDLQGSIVPAYALNAVLGEVPLLGGALVSRRGEGLLAVTYTMKGPVADPKVQTNPLSALAPGFLRRIFEAPTPKAPPSDIAPPG